MILQSNLTKNIYIKIEKLCFYHGFPLFQDSSYSKRTAKLTVNFCLYFCAQIRKQALADGKVETVASNTLR